MELVKVFYSADMSDEQFYSNMNRAYTRYEQGESPCYSSGICGTVTAGYGILDPHGYWEFPLEVVMLGGVPHIAEEIE